jgi:hypothetical protein
MNGIPEMVMSLYLYNEEKKIFKLTNKDEAIDQLIECKICDIEEFYEEHKQSLTDNVKKIIEIIIDDRYENDDKPVVNKQIRDNINIILNEMCSRYDSYDQNIVGNINNKLLNDINEIENDKIRAHDRLDITKIRITENYNNEKIKINNLINNNKLNLDNFEKESNKLTLELDNIKLMIENENYIDNELTKINNEINKYQEIIQQMQKDLDNISNTI